MKAHSLTRKAHSLTRSFIACFALVALPASAAVVFTITDTRPGETAVTTATTTLGSVSSTAAVPTAVYTITGLDLTSVGGGASETIAFNITYSATGGDGVPQINGFGNISVTGGQDDNQINIDETLTATISLNSGATTFTGNINLGFINTTAGGAGSGETWNVIHDGGTTAGSFATGNTTSFASSSFVTYDVTGGSNPPAINLQGFEVEISAAAVPEPSVSLLTALGVFLLMRRRRCS